MQSQIRLGENLQCRVSTVHMSLKSGVKLFCVAVNSVPSKHGRRIKVALGASRNAVESCQSLHPACRLDDAACSVACRVGKLLCVTCWDELGLIAVRDSQATALRSSVPVWLDSHAAGAGLISETVGMPATRCQTARLTSATYKPIMRLP